MMLASSFNGFAQEQNDVERAVQIFQSGNVESAVKLIDSCALNPKYSKTWEVWYYKGFFYKELSKKQSIESAIENRIIAFESIKKAMILDTKNENREQDSLNLRYLTNKFNNDAATLITETNYKKSAYVFDYYLKALKLQNNTPEKIKQIIIDYQSAVGSMFIDVFEKNPKNNHAFNMAIKSYQEVLLLDSNSSTANYQIGVNYYNKGASIINSHNVEEINFDADQELSLLEFKKALPYLLKAFNLNPKRKETIEGLRNIYMALNNKEKEEFYDKELVKLKPKE